MPKKHASDRSILRYNIKSPDEWAAIRGEWEDGASLSELHRRHAVGVSTISNRRDKEQWRRRPSPAVRDSHGEIDPVRIAEAALSRAADALAQGRGGEALTLIKAADAVGQFADFVARLKAASAPTWTLRDGGPVAGARLVSRRLDWRTLRAERTAVWRALGEPADSAGDGAVEAALAAHWSGWLALSHPAQRPPEGAWRTWLFLGGRGAGKTRAGAQWLSSQARDGARLAMVGPTLHEVRAVMVEGESGLIATAAKDARPRWEATRRRLVWPGGAQAQAFSAEDPDALRGAQFHSGWADEFCAWRGGGEAALANLRLGLRLGTAPRLLVTTTPKPTAALRRLRTEPRAGGDACADGGERRAPRPVVPGRPDGRVRRDPAGGAGAGGAGGGGRGRPVDRRAAGGVPGRGAAARGAGARRRRGGPAGGRPRGRRLSLRDRGRRADERTGGA
jgi:hypothetical protein